MHRFLPNGQRPVVRLLLAIAVLSLLASDARAFILAPSTRWTSSASGATGTYGDPIKLTWSLPPANVNISGSFGTIGTKNDLIATFDTAFGAGPGGTDLTQRPWFHLFDDSFKRWNALGGINFVYESHDTTNTIGGSSAGVLGTRGDIRIGGTNYDGAGDTLAATLFPNNGDMVIDTAEINYYASASDPNRVRFRNTLTHEAGHALGFEHVVSDSNNFLMEPVIDESFDGPQLDDIRALHYFYGDKNEKSNNGQGNDTSALATPLGAIATGASVEIGTSARASLQVNPTDVDFVSVSNNNDPDYYSFTVAGAAKLTAVLSPRGGQFDQAEQTEPQIDPTPFNANTSSNLTLTLFNTNGTSQLILVNSTGAGADETLSDFSLSGGQYFVRVTGAASTVQMYDLKLSIAATFIPGDYNHDGTVDTADYTVWRDTDGETGSGLAADGNNNGTVDVADYDVWQAHFGESAGSGSMLIPAPEPSTLLLLAMIFFVPVRRPRSWTNSAAILARL